MANQAESRAMRRLENSASFARIRRKTRAMGTLISAGWSTPNPLSFSSFYSAMGFGVVLIFRG